MKKKYKSKRRYKIKKMAMKKLINDESSDSEFKIMLDDIPD